MREFDRNRQDAMPPREPTQAMMDAAATMHTEMIVHCTRGPNYNHVWYAMYDAWQNEQTSGSTEGRAGYCVPRSDGEQSDGASVVAARLASNPEREGRRPAGIKPGPLDRQSAATPAAGRPDAGAAQAVTDGPAADPDASVITYARIGLRYMHDPRVRATYSDLIDLAERMARERDDARAERDALRECVLAADQTARFDLAWLISAINVHRHLPRPVGPELPKWYAENDRWLREASEMLTTIHNAEAFIVPSAERNTSQQKHKEDAAQIVDLLHERDALRECVRAADAMALECRRVGLISSTWLEDYDDASAKVKP